MRNILRFLKQKQQNIKFPKLPAEPLLSTRSRGILSVNTTKCTLCGDCQELCPSNAISIKNNSLQIDYSLCLWCNYCVIGCEEKALSFVKTYKGTIRSKKDAKQSFKPYKY